MGRTPLEVDAMSLAQWLAFCDGQRQARDPAGASRPKPMSIGRFEELKRAVDGR